MNAKINIREARTEDAARLAGLSNQLGYPSATGQVLARLERLSARADSKAIVADLEGAGVVGWIHVYSQVLLETDLHAEVGGLVVDQDCRGQGIGKLLLEAAETWAREQGCGYMAVRSNVIRERAHAFYQREGYRIKKSQYTLVKDL